MRAAWSSRISFSTILAVAAWASADRSKRRARRSSPRSRLSLALSRNRFSRRRAASARSCAVCRSAGMVNRQYPAARERNPQIAETFRGHFPAHCQDPFPTALAGSYYARLGRDLERLARVKGEAIWKLPLSSARPGLGGDASEDPCIAGPCGRRRGTGQGEAIRTCEPSAVAAR
jgi:hypothetical protein